MRELTERENLEFRTAEIKKKNTWLVGTWGIILEIAVDEMIGQILGKQSRVAWDLTGNISN